MPMARDPSPAHMHACSARSVGAMQACGPREYVPSRLEQWWRAHARDMLGDSRHFTAGCAALHGNQSLIDEWLQLAKVRTHSARAADNRSAAVSFHRVRGCAHARAVVPREDFREVPIEPLAGFLRHPHHFCFKKMSMKVDKSYLMPPWLVEVEPQPRRAFLFDAGASTWIKGMGGKSQGWFVDESSRRGLPLQQLVAWEAKPRSDAEIRMGLPTWLARGVRIYRQPPPLTTRSGSRSGRRHPHHEVADRANEARPLIGASSEAASTESRTAAVAALAASEETFSYHNYPISAVPGAPSNPLAWLLALTEPDDFVIFKLDIDTPSIERQLVEQLLSAPELLARVDEFFWEHEVSGSPMVHQGWASSRPTETLQESYELFSRLREAGIRAHSWV